MIKKKARSAIEFSVYLLVRVILLILLIFGTILFFRYFNVQSLGAFLPENCMFPSSPFSCKGQEYTIKNSESNTVQIQLQNTFGRGVKISNIKVIFADFPTINCNNAAGSINFMDKPTVSANGDFSPAIEMYEAEIATLYAACINSLNLEPGKKTKIIVQITWQESSASSTITKVSEGWLYLKVQPN